MIIAIMASTALALRSSTSMLHNSVPKSTTMPSFLICSRKSSCISLRTRLSSTPTCRKCTTVVAVSMEEVPKMQQKGGIVQEMRSEAMKLRSRDQDQYREGEQEPDVHVSIDGCLRYLVNAKIIYDTLEAVIQKATYPSYVKFTNTGLERSDALREDLEWFKEQGHTIPEPSSNITSYAHELEELSEKNQPAFVCHFYSFYFYIVGGRTIHRKVSEITRNEKTLEFCKWKGNPEQLAQNLGEKINEVAANWSRVEKDSCLEETEISFAYKNELYRILLSQ